MEGMFHSRIPRLCVVLAMLLLIAGPVTANAEKARYRGRKFKPPPPVARIVVTVLRNDNDTPIRNAHVIFHPVENNKVRGGMELKTDNEGVAVMTVIPIGDTILLQVLAHGYQTYGGRYKIATANEAMQIKMKLPGEQYSVYDNQMTSDDGNGSGGTQQNGAKAAPNGSSNDKSSAPPKN